MTAAIYFEARGESYIGQTAIAQVVQNRTNHPDFPNTVCKVIKQPFQFSWYNKEKHIQNILKGRIIDLKNKDREMYLQAKDIASKAVLGLIEYNPKLEDALYFVHKSVSSKQQPWLKKLKIAATIENHKFYRKVSHVRV